MIRKLILIIFLLFPVLGWSQKLLPAVTQPIPIDQLQNFDHYQKSLQQLIIQAGQLIDLKLTYLFGSDNPKLKGMDCSGTIYYLLQRAGVKDIPRSANAMYLWAKQKGKFYFVNNPNFNSSEFANLKPGDLLFWSGTYQTNTSQNKITHVMIYLGKNLQNQPLMFGSSDGRSYQGKRMWGVSVFDFKLPKPGKSSPLLKWHCELWI
jgi:cell wall-associated NlpC family hydrolase